ncbi:MAG: helix-turn-helix domain-containing protein, partial [Planctomycetia bacterium]
GVAISAPAAAAPPSLAGRTLAELERQAIIDTLAACGGNKKAAARKLGIDEKSIYNKMKRLGVGDLE